MSYSNYMCTRYHMSLHGVSRYLPKSMSHVTECFFMSIHTVTCPYILSHAHTYCHMSLHCVTCPYIQSHVLTFFHIPIHAVTCPYMLCVQTQFLYVRHEHWKETGSKVPEQVLQCIWERQRMQKEGEKMV